MLRPALNCVALLACFVTAMPATGGEPFLELRSTLEEKLGFELGPCPEELAVEPIRNAVTWCGSPQLDFPRFRRLWKQTWKRTPFLGHHAPGAWEKAGDGLHRSTFWYRDTPGILAYDENGGHLLVEVSTALATCEETGYADRWGSGRYASRTTEGILQPRRIAYSEPEMPKSARQERRGGTVLLAGIVDTDGRLDGLCVLDADPDDRDLKLAAARAVQKWVYEPAMLEGEPTEFFLVINVSFSFR